MNAIALENKLINNNESIEQILHGLGFIDLKYHRGKNYYTFPRIDGDNPNGLIFYCDTLRYNSFTRNDKGNLFSMVMKIKDCTFPESLKWIVSCLNLEESEFDVKYELPFGGFFQELIADELGTEIELKKYDIEILDEYANRYTTQFFKDGISYIVQEEYQFGYDFSTNRITIPQWDIYGNLIGIMGRFNGECDKSERWLPIIPCSRSHTISAYHRNYKAIQEKGICVIGESDKFPAQLKTFGCNIGLALNGCNISKTQADYLKMLGVSKYILALDEGLDEEFIREQAKKIKIEFSNCTNEVGYIYDKDNKYLAKSGKHSPSDHGREVFNRLYRECTVWL